MTYNGASVITEIEPFGLSGVLVEYIKKGHERPMDGNRVVVEARVSLPADQDTIRDDYVYGDKLSLFGKPLEPSWGNSIVQGRRTFVMTIKADDYDEGFQEARNAIESELRDLKSIVTNRFNNLEEEI